MRVGGNYERTLENVRGLLRLKRELGVCHPEILVQFVEMDINAHARKAFTEYWQQQGAAVKIRPKAS